MSLSRKEMDDLRTERKEYGHYNNLVVVATGVGKTLAKRVNTSKS